jgi:hypothetical protein
VNRITYTKFLLTAALSPKTTKYLITGKDSVLVWDALKILERRLRIEREVSRATVFADEKIGISCGYFDSLEKYLYFNSPPVLEDSIWNRETKVVRCIVAVYFWDFEVPKDWIRNPEKDFTWIDCSSVVHGKSRFIKARVKEENATVSLEAEKFLKELKPTEIVTLCKYLRVHSGTVVDKQTIMKYVGEGIDDLQKDETSLVQSLLYKGKMTALKEYGNYRSLNGMRFLQILYRELNGLLLVKSLPRNQQFKLLNLLGMSSFKVMYYRDRSQKFGAKELYRWMFQTLGYLFNPSMVSIPFLISTW